MSSNHPILELRPPLVMMEKTIKWKPNKTELAPNCPRCSSSNTKFCYYNNYSVSQPRYFCKSCRRYWTKGGSLRNVPIGGGCRKSRRGRPARQDSPPPSLASRMEPESGGVVDVGISAGECAVYEDVRTEDGTVFECGKSVVDDRFLQVNEYIDGQDFVYENYDAFEGGDQMLWSQIYGAEQTNPMGEHMQEFGMFDQIMSGNFVTDNWGSFDLSGYDDF